MTADEIRRATIRLSHEIVEKQAGTEGLLLIGIQRRGVPLAHRIAAAIAENESVDIPVGALDITFAIPEDQVAAQLTQALGDIKPDSVVLEEPEIKVSTTIDLFFFKLPVGIGLEPSAEEGRMVFTPTSVKLGDQDYTPDELRAEIGDLADPFLAQQKLCVSDAIPAALSLGDVDVVAKDLVLKIEGENVALGGPEMSTNGTCDG